MIAAQYAEHPPQQHRCLSLWAQDKMVVSPDMMILATSSPCFKGEVNIYLGCD